MAAKKKILHRQSRGRPLGSMNKSTADQMELQERMAQNGMFTIAEIAYIMANEAFDVLGTIEAIYGIDSDQYYRASTNAQNAVKMALPYFTSQAKFTVQVE